MNLFFLLIIILFSYKAIKEQYNGYDINIFSGLNISYILLITATLIFILLTLFYFKTEKTAFNYLIIFIGIIAIILVAFKIKTRSNIINSKTIFKVSNMAGAEHVITFDFKDNGKFSLTEFNMLGQTIYYGNYTKVNNTLSIINANYNKEVIKLPLVGTIKNDTVYWKNFDTMLIDTK